MISYDTFTCFKNVGYMLGDFNDRDLHITRIKQMKQPTGSGKNGLQ